MAGFAALMRSVSVTGAAKQLSVLLAALDANFPTRLGLLIVQMDPASAGNLYVGNSAVAANNCGANLIASGSYTINPADNGLILTTDVYLLVSAGTIQANITALPKGM